MTFPGSNKTRRTTWKTIEHLTLIIPYHQHHRFDSKAVSIISNFAELNCHFRFLGLTFKYFGNGHSEDGENNIKLEPYCYSILNHSPLLLEKGWNSSFHELTWEVSSHPFQLHRMSRMSNSPQGRLLMINIKVLSFISRVLCRDCMRTSEQKTAVCERDDTSCKGTESKSRSQDESHRKHPFLFFLSTTSSFVFCPPLQQTLGR
jgi:hypothetical protein